LLIAFACLGIAAAIGPGAVPIYDGIGNPDEPYRYVDPPANYRTTKPPTTATDTLKVTNGQSESAQINTSEYGPQLALYVPVGAFAAPAGQGAVTVTASPVSAPDTSPSDGAIEGNVYRVTATSRGRAVDLIGFGTQAPVLDLRAPTARQPGPVFEHYESGEWTAHQTSRVGTDIYRTRMSALGYWALVRRDASAGGSGALLPTVAGVLGGCGAVLGALAIRRRRIRHRAAE
jgi:hypothetical protein